MLVYIMQFAFRSLLVGGYPGCTSDRFGWSHTVFHSRLECISDRRLSIRRRGQRMCHCPVDHAPSVLLRGTLVRHEDEGRVYVAHI